MIMKRSNCVHLPLVSLLFLLLSCGGKELHRVVIDNPLRSPLDVRVGTDFHQLMEGERKTLRLPAGPHRFIATRNGEETLLDSLLQIEADGLLNLTHSHYICWTYTYTAAGAMSDHSDYKTIEIMGQPFYGDFRVYEADDLWIERDWDLDMDTEFPEEIRNVRDEELSLTKLYRMTEFVGDYNRFYSSK